MGTAEKTDCAREAFLEFRRRTHRADIASLPTMRRWFGIGTFHKPTREHVIHMCFALDLSEEQAQEYLKKGLSEPGFQVNNYQELIFLYGIVNHYTYEECLSMMRQFEQNFDREFTYSNHAATQQINQKFEQVKLYPRDEFLLWMADHADWFKGYSRTTLDYLIQYRKIILTAARKESRRTSLLYAGRNWILSMAREAPGAVREQGVNPLLSASQKYKRLSYLGTHERECAGTGAGSLSGKRYEYFNYSRNL